MIPRLYLTVGALLIAGGVALWVDNLWENNRRLSSQNEELTLQIEKNAENVRLLVQQLDREIEYRQIAESVLEDLGKEVPNVVYSQSLPPEIQGVLDRFHERIHP